MQPSKVTQVIGIATKKDGSELKGIGKTGKPWTMYSVILENGIKLNVFGPVGEGDTVYDLVQDSQYKTWNGKVKREISRSETLASTDISQPNNATILDAILRLEKKVDKLVQINTGGDVVLEDIDDKPIDLSEIPF